MVEIITKIIPNLLLDFWGQADNFMRALILFVIIDYITGICAATKEKCLSSNVGAIGIAKKVSIFLVVAVSHVVDQYLMEQENVLRTVTVMFYISNEGISILENIGKTGVPLPEKLISVLKYLKKKDN